MYKKSVIQLKPFPNMLYVYIGTDGSIIDDIFKSVNVSLYGRMNENDIGIFISEDIKAAHYLIYVENKRDLLHEIVHAVDYLMDDYQIDSKEFRAYYTEFLNEYLSNEKNYVIINKKVNKNKKSA